MKVYVLTDGVDEFERDTVGVFSSLEKLQDAINAFNEYGGSRGDLLYNEYELDELEPLLSVILSEIKSGYRIYHLHRYVKSWSTPNWNINLIQPYEFKYEKDEVGSYAIGDTTSQYATIRAKSKEDAIETVERMLKEQAT